MYEIIDAAEDSVNASCVPVGGIVILIIISAPFLLYHITFNVLLRGDEDYASHACPHFIASCLLLGCILLLAWTIPCSIWIYSVSPSYGEEDDAYYCDYPIYVVAFASVTIVNIALALALAVLFLFCVGICCQNCCRM